VRHRLNKPDYTVKFCVELVNGHLINLPERELQATYPEVVYAYWKSYAGGRCSITGYNRFHPFFILAHREKRGTTTMEYKVQ
jgi:hypothetical protein